MPDNDNLVSVIVPAYNSAKWIARALDSIFRQTWTDLEVLVVDDGSTDDTEAVVNRYGGHVRYFKKANGGVSSARNYGLSKCRGEFVAFLDADDEFLPNMIESLMEAFKRFPRIGAASGAHLYRSNEQTARRPLKGEILGGDVMCGIVEDFCRVYSSSFVTCTGSVLVRRSVFEKVGGFREDIHFGEDLEQWVRVAGQFDWAFVDKEMMVYNHHPATSATLQALRPATIDWLYDEKQMKSLLRPQLWGGYRVLRRSSLKKISRKLISQGHGPLARKALLQMGPACWGIEAWAMLILTLLPGPILVRLIKAIQFAMRLGTIKPD